MRKSGISHKGHKRSLGTNVVNRERPGLIFPHFFAALPLPCILLNANRRTKDGRGLGTGKSHTDAGIYRSGCIHVAQKETAFEMCLLSAT